MKDDSRPIVIALVIVALGAGGFFLWRRQQRTPPAVTADAAVAPVAVAPHEAPPDVAPEAGVQHPVDPPERAARLPPLDESDEYIRKLLGEVVGSKSLMSLIRVNQFARGFVATVDNLANSTAASRMWPLEPTEGRFVVDRGESAIAPENSRRYAAFVRLVEAVPAERAARVYRSLYPLFQQAYEEMGYPGRYFNDRLIEVIDHLLATPAVAEPVAIKRVQVEGAPEVKLYQFVDPTLERASAGRKILWRVGTANAARLKAKLAEVPPLVARRPPR